MIFQTLKPEWSRINFRTCIQCHDHDHIIKLSFEFLNWTPWVKIVCGNMNVYMHVFRCSNV